ncbi:copper resistance protein CopC [Paenarthrobacter sp. Z7-10]|uniref:copper resistance CopC family protein n=1 Tax=Paenarthrobacter sp. Z7-10 TaxID=2787635 RepID=UPI0022A911EA|nr:copper resistance CopC family protein [Paenarthrobacter sp. Z7-10]MCZ2403354.1 copper resistance protein CopC [Paenarthrobacter sp. Z7-10]
MTAAQQTVTGTECVSPTGCASHSTGRTWRDVDFSGSWRPRAACTSGGLPSSERALRRLSTVVLTAAVLLLALFGAAPAASAHDVAESTSPADGSTVADMPDKVSITLNNTPGALGSAIQINDANGRNWAEGPVQVVDHVATQQVMAGAPAGKYTVLWRLVSSDSHPVDGTFSFTTTGGSSGGSAAGTQTPLQPGTPAAAQSAGSFPWGIAVIIVVLVLVVAGLGFIAKRRLGREDSREEAAEDGTDDGREDS